MSLIGMGQLAPGPASSPACGTNPCGVFDYVWLSDSCQSYLGCADPTNSLYVGATQGALALVGQAAGTAVASTGSGLATGLAAGLGVTPTVIYIGAAIAGFFLIKSLVKK